MAEPMNCHVNIMAKAQGDVLEICGWLSQFSPEAAADWHAAIIERIQTLEENPLRCPLAREAGKLGIELRELTFGKRRGTFRILFTIDANNVNVLRIRRATRDLIKANDL